MLATRDKAEQKFFDYLKLANGDSLLVYKALSLKHNEQERKEYIRNHISETNTHHAHMQ
jgi:hypothetical protein